MSGTQSGEPDDHGSVGVVRETAPPWQVEEGVRSVVCPDCAFTFSAEHTETDGGLYDCPACWAHRALYLKCHICGHAKWASTPERATYMLAFHMDRRHKGWTITAPDEREGATDGR